MSKSRTNESGTPWYFKTHGHYSIESEEQRESLSPTTQPGGKTQAEGEGGGTTEEYFKTHGHYSIEQDKNRPSLTGEKNRQDIGS